MECKLFSSLRSGLVQIKGNVLTGGLARVEHEGNMVNLIYGVACVASWCYGHFQEVHLFQFSKGPRHLVSQKGGSG